MTVGKCSARMQVLCCRVVTFALLSLFGSFDEDGMASSTMTRLGDRCCGWTLVWLGTKVTSSPPGGWLSALLRRRWRSCAVMAIGNVSVKIWWPVGKWKTFTTLFLREPTGFGCSAGWRTETMRWFGFLTTGLWSSVTSFSRRWWWIVVMTFGFSCQRRINKDDLRKQSRFSFIELFVVL